MLAFGEGGGDVCGDATDAGVRWRLPSALVPVPGPDGTPQVLLCRSAGAGLLHLRLKAGAPALAAGERLAPVASARFRLCLTTPAASEAGGWWQGALAGDTVVDRSVSLGAAEAAIAWRLGQRAEEVVEVEVELALNGYAPRYPWLAGAAMERIGPRLAAKLGDGTVDDEAFEAAFLGLAAEDFDWHPLAPGALPPPTDEALRTIAQHALPLLYERTPAGWQRRDAAAPARIEVNLDVPRLQTRRIALRWSFSQFLAAQPEPGRHLLDVATPKPFEPALLALACDLPLAAGGIEGIAVEVRSGGPSGLLRHEFLPGQASAAQLRYVRASFDVQPPQWRARASVRTPDGPALVETDFREAGTLVDIDAASLGLHALRFVAAGEVFDALAAVEVVLGTRRLRLTPAQREQWAVGRQPPARVELIAELADGSRGSLGDWALEPGGLRVGAAQLGIGDSVDVRLRLSPDDAARLAYLAVQLEGRGWRTLDLQAEGAQLTVALPRAHRLAVPRLRYRLRSVSRSADGRTAPMADSPWRDAAGVDIAMGL